MSDGQKYRAILPQHSQHGKHKHKTGSDAGNDRLGSAATNSLSSDASVAVQAIGPIREPVVDVGPRKRKRIGTQIACNACRQKKIRVSPHYLHDSCENLAFVLH